MNQFHKQFHTRAHETRLTDAERSRIQGALQTAMLHAPVPSPFFTSGFFFSRALVAGAIVIVITGSTAYAAEGALPGDLLYPVKVSVNEPASGALAFSASAKAKWHAQIAETRLAEAETLADKGTLTASTSDELAANFTEHAQAVAALTGDNASVQDISSQFSSAVARHGAAILAAGKRSKNAIALRASGDLVVNVAGGESDSHSGRPAAAVRTAAPALFKASTLSAPASGTSDTTTSDEADRLRAALAHATSTLSTQTLLSFKSATRVAAIENLIVKGDAELSLGSDAKAAEDFAEAQSRIDGLNAQTQNQQQIVPSVAPGVHVTNEEIRAESGDSESENEAFPE